LITILPLFLSTSLPTPIKKPLKGKIIIEGEAAGSVPGFSFLLQRGVQLSLSCTIPKPNKAHGILPVGSATTFE